MSRVRPSSDPLQAGTVCESLGADAKRHLTYALTALEILPPTSARAHYSYCVLEHVRAVTISTSHKLPRVSINQRSEYDLTLDQRRTKLHEPFVYKENMQSVD